MKLDQDCCTSISSADLKSGLAQGCRANKMLQPGFEQS